MAIGNLRATAVAVFAAAALLGCQGIQISPQEVVIKLVTPSARQIEAIKHGIASQLRYPASTRFGAVIMGESGDGHFSACGYVSGKTSSEGSASMTPFLGEFVGNEFVLAAIGGTPKEMLKTRAVCAMHGLPLSEMRRIALPTDGSRT